MSIKEFLTGTPDPDIHVAAPVPGRLKKNEKIIMITGEDVEDIEFFYPYYRFTEEGYTVDVVTIEGGAFKGKHGIGLQNSKTITAVRPNDYALLYLPGGKAPAKLRKNDAVLSFVRAFAQTDKPIAAVCHGPQILMSAGLTKGVQMACWPEIADELEDAGGEFVDEALVIDKQFITARMPGDLHRHLYGVLQFMEGKVQNELRDIRRARRIRSLTTGTNAASRTF
jgi:protease I